MRVGGSRWTIGREVSRSRRRLERVGVIDNIVERCLGDIVHGLAIRLLAEKIITLFSGDRQVFIRSVTDSQYLHSLIDDETDRRKYVR